MNENLKSKIEELANDYANKGMVGDWSMHGNYIAGAKAMHDILMPIILMQRNAAIELRYDLERRHNLDKNKMTDSELLIIKCLEQTDKMLKGEL